MQMISFQQAYDTMMSRARFLGAEDVPFLDASGRVLAADVVSDVDMPPFDKSAMDGFACRRSDLGVELRIVEEIPAGRFPARKIGQGECARIMTGAPVPDGADMVFMVEDSGISGEGKVHFTGEKSACNICARGEDVKAGDVVLRNGTILTPARVGVLAAALGKATVTVARRPRVGLISTGDELVEPWQKTGPAGIRNTNSHQLSAQVTAIGALPVYHGIVADRREAILDAVMRLKRDCDVTVLTGGVSAGDYDFVPGVLKDSGYGLFFEKVAMQPGKPMVFGEGDSGFCCGMPGNPVSTFVVFELMLKPFLYRLMGTDALPPMTAMELDRDVVLKNSERQVTIPVVFTGAGTAAPLEYHGSAHILAMARADGLLTIPAGTTVLKKGAIVNVRRI